MEHLPNVEKFVRLHGKPISLVDSEVTDTAVRILAVYSGDALEDLSHSYELILPQKIQI